MPSLLTTLLIPFTFSIADGFGVGIISYVVLKTGCKETKDLNPVFIVLEFIFVGYFIYLARL